MKLALFDDHRLGAVVGEEIADVTPAVPGHDPNPLTAGWWRGLAGGLDDLRPELDKLAADPARRRPLASVELLAPALNPSKIVACASNYREHVEEMHGVQSRTLGAVHDWMMRFDVFLKAPSSLSGPNDDIVLPREIVGRGFEIHHESELVIVVGRGGKDIPVEDALDAVLGYTIGLDITVRSEGDRSRRKSYDTFSPLGPWITTRDEAAAWDAMEIELVRNGTERRQHVHTRDLITPVPEIVSYASRIMTLMPGDLIFTGAPPGVGPISRGDTLSTTISSIGSMTVGVR
ncbi:fumarylacetoacetate hydrolase family protein [Nonomuraea sp. B12E4]|uniref:fumarylacetoacetate hydrolase family protein n=1 Tax=Nonomuraea sp. B12E4 TaxID=3153564 RepID=UPI00325EC335